MNIESSITFADTVDAFKATFAVSTRPPSKGRSSATNHSSLHASQATGSLAHIVGKAWTGPNRCPNGQESAVHVQAWGKPLDGTKPCAREAFTVHSVLKCGWCFIIISIPNYSLNFQRYLVNLNSHIFGQPPKEELLWTKSFHYCIAFCIVYNLQQ